MKLVLERHTVDTSTKPVNYPQVLLQVAFDLAALYLLHQSYIYVWRAMTGH